MANGRRSNGGRVVLALLVAPLLMARLASPVGAETLEEAWAMAVAGNPMLQAARQETDASAHQLRAARAGRLPSLEINGGYQVKDNDPATWSGGAAQTTSEAESLSYGLDLTIPLFSSGRVSAEINAAERDVEAAQLAARQAERDLKLETAAAFITVLRARSALASAISHAASLEAHLRDVESRSEQGMASRTDLLSAQVTLANAEQERIRRDSAAAIALAAYNRLLVQPLERQPDLEAPTLAAPDEALAALQQEAVAERPEWAILTQRIEALRRRAQAESARFGPRAGILAGYDFAENAHQVHEGVWSAKLALVWPLYDGDAAGGRAAALASQADALASQRADLESTIAFQVQKAWLELRDAVTQLGVVQEALAHAEENLTMTRHRFREGLSSNADVLDAESLRTTSHGNFDAAHYDHMLAVITLRHAAGAL